MRRSKWNTGIRSFLEAHNVDWNDPVAIASLKKTYWSAKKRAYKAERRKTHYEVTVYFTEEEIKRLDKLAKEYRLSRPKYMKQTALNHFQTPDIGEIKLLLYRNYNAVLALGNNGRLSSKIVNELLGRIGTMEQEVIKQLTEPKICKRDR